MLPPFQFFGELTKTREGRLTAAANQSAMSGTGMTQEMEMLAFEGSQGVELTDEEAEASARAYDEAQVRAENRARPQGPQPCCTA